VLIPVCSARQTVQRTAPHRLLGFGRGRRGHTRADSMRDRPTGLAQPRPVIRSRGPSMGGLRRGWRSCGAPRAGRRLALLDTRPGRPSEQSERRRAQRELARSGRLAEVLDQLLPVLVHARRQHDGVLRGWWTGADEVGAEAFAASRPPIIGRADSLPAWPPLLPDAGPRSATAIRSPWIGPGVAQRSRRTAPGRRRFAGTSRRSSSGRGETGRWRQDRR